MSFLLCVPSRTVLLSWYIGLSLRFVYHVDLYLLIRDHGVLNTVCQPLLADRARRIVILFLYFHSLGSFVHVVAVGDTVHDDNDLSVVCIVRRLVSEQVD